jgi:hypothetical protein
MLYTVRLILLREGSMTTVGGKYARRLSRQYPGLFVLLLDQSGSMIEQVPSYNRSKADIATSALNNIIHEMIKNAGFDDYDPGTRKKYAYISIFGYSDSVYPLLTKTGEPVDIATLAERPRGIAPVSREIHKGSEVLHRTEKLPYWIEPYAQGRTNMVLAFQRAKEVVQHWLSSPPLERWQAPHSECFPPIVINITDAQHNSSGNPVREAQEIQRLSSREGNTLVFNCHFTRDGGSPYVFPNNPNDVRRLDTVGLAAMMYDMSSIIPEPLRDDASRVSGSPLAPGARCFAYNANPDVLIKFLRWGTLAVPFHDFEDE